MASRHRPPSTPPSHRPPAHPTDPIEIAEVRAIEHVVEELRGIKYLLHEIVEELRRHPPTSPVAALRLIPGRPSSVPPPPAS